MMYRGMTRRCLLFLAAMVLLAGTVQVTDAGASTTSTSVTSLSPAACKALVSAKSDPKASADLKAALARPDACKVTVQTTRPIMASKVAQSASSTACGYYEAIEWVGPWGAAARWGAHSWMCWNGNSVWAGWGPDCGGWVAPTYVSGYDWCGVWNNWGSYADIGANWWLATWYTPWWHICGCWVRKQIYNNGNASGTWGG